LPILQYIYISALVLIISLISFSHSVAQQSLIKDFELESMAKSVEALGMGGAFYSKSDNKYAAFYNPAGLTRVKNRSIDIIPLTLGIDSDTIPVISGILDSISGSNGSSSDVSNAVNDIIDLFRTKFMTIGPISFFPAYTAKGISFGLFSNTVIKATAYNKAISEVTAIGKSDNGLTFAIAKEFLSDNSLSIGISLKALVRAQLNKTYTIFEITDIVEGNSDIVSDLVNDLFNSGIGIGAYASLGAIYELPFLDMLAPRVALSINDIGYMYQVNVDKNIVDTIKPTLNASVAISPHYYNIVKTDIMIDIVDILYTASDDTSILKRINIGAELLLYDTIAFRAGIHQGFPTAGFGLFFKYFKLNYAFYTEELGSEVNQLKDTRHVLEFVFRI